MQQAILQNDARRVIRWSDGKILSRSDGFRLSFSGVTMLSSTCTDYGCPANNWMRVQSGTLNDYAYDSVWSSCVGGIGASWLMSALSTCPTLRFGSTSGCLSTMSTTGAAVNFMYGGPNPGKIIVEIGRSLSGLSHTLFEGVFDLCDLADGMEIPNSFVAGGCGTLARNGGASGVYGYGGTCILSRFCP